MRLKDFDLFTELLAKERLGFFFLAILNGIEQLTLFLGHIEEELRIVMWQVLCGLFKVRHKRSREDLEDAVTTSF